MPLDPEVMEELSIDALRAQLAARDAEIFQLRPVREAARALLVADELHGLAIEPEVQQAIDDLRAALELNR